MSLVTLSEIKEFLSINPSNTTDDARMQTIAKQVSSLVTSYCGREFVARDRVEYFNGGTSSVFVANPPINAVFSVEGPGIVLNSPSRAGSPVSKHRNPLTVTSTAALTTKVRKHGQASLKVDGVGYATIQSDESLELGTDDFTIDIWVRFDDVMGRREFLVADAWSFGIENGKLFFNDVEESEVFPYKTNRFYRFGATRKDGLLTIYRDKEIVAQEDIDLYISESDIVIGKNMFGYIDTLYISSVVESFYSDKPIIPDDNTIVSLSFDGPDGSTNITDSVPSGGDFAFNLDTGEIMFDSSNGELSLSGPTTFGSSPMSVRVSYNGGYLEVPDDIKMATLEMLKIVYKGKTGTEINTMRGENLHSYALAIDDFPPHVRRVLNLYRIVM